MRARAALVCAVLAIVAGMAIAGVKIARADGGGACIYNAIVAPIAGYPTLPWCDSSRNVGVNIRAGNFSATVLANNADGVSAAAIGLATASSNYGFNGTSWDRLRSNTGTGDGLTMPASGIQEILPLNFGFDGTFWDRMRVTNGEQQTTDGGNTLATLTATTCTVIAAASTTVHRIWSAGAETASVQLYTDSGCTSALYNKVPPNGSPDVLDAPVPALYYKLSAAAAVKDYLTRTN